MLFKPSVFEQPVLSSKHLTHLLIIIVWLLNTPENFAPITDTNRWADHLFCV
ncbi:hypothetical protein JCM19376_12710 [Fusibacter bizertensis]